MGKPLERVSRSTLTLLCLLDKKFAIPAEQERPCHSIREQHDRTMFGVLGPTEILGFSIPDYHLHYGS